MIALIGEKEIWNGFTPLGVKIFEVETRDEIFSALDEVENADFLFVLISDQAAVKIEKDLNDIFKKRKMKIFLLSSINSKDQKNELYYKRLKTLTEQAMGVDVLTEK